MYSSRIFFFFVSDFLFKKHEVNGVGTAILQFEKVRFRELQGSKWINRKFSSGIPLKSNKLVKFYEHYGWDNVTS